MISTAFSPAHITGFFEIGDGAQDPLRRGSRGAGVCLAKGVKTEVQTTDHVGEVNVFINGIPSSSAVVSGNVAMRLLAMSKPVGLMIRHEIPVPIASGFGTSGAAAIGVALAGSDALGLRLSSLESIQLAHTVEVELRTGLGTVAGEFCGGLEVRSKEGAPGYGKVFQAKLDGSYTVVALHNGPLQTSRFLSDASYRKRINSIGRDFSDKMVRSPDLQTFLKLTHEFSSAIGLGNDFLRKVMNLGDDHGYLFGMAMFGQTVFTIVKDDAARDVADLIRKNVKEGKMIISPVDQLGARLLESPYCIASR